MNIKTISFISLLKKSSKLLSISDTLTDLYECANFVKHYMAQNSHLKSGIQI